MSIREKIYPLLEIALDKGAVEHEGAWFSWGQVKSLVDQLTVLLSGLPAGTPVGLLCRNQPEIVGALTGVICANCCLVPVNPFTSPEKILADLQELNLPVLLATASDWTIPGLREHAHSRSMMAICVDGDSLACLPGLEKPGSGTYREAMPEVAVEMLSSGTTGKPKRIRLTSSNLEKGLAGKAQLRDGKLVLRSSAGLVSAPLVHISGIFWVLSHMAEGRASVMLERFSVASWVGAVKRHSLRYAGLVPTGIKMVLDANVLKEDIASLFAVRSGTAPLPPELQRVFEEKYGIPVLNVYGATEFAGGVAGWTLDLRKEFANQKAGSVGRAFAGVEIRIIDANNGEQVATGETGILTVKAPQLGGKDWVRTTDLASTDADGFLWIRGRADNAIIRGGFKIIPTEVVAVLEGHPAVLHASVVGIPDERLGQIPVAAVELRPGFDAISGDVLRQWAKDHMTSYHVPVQIKVLATLPRTPSMKVSEPDVKALFAR